MRFQYLVGEMAMLRCMQPEWRKVSQLVGVILLNDSTACHTVDNLFYSGNENDLLLCPLQ
jgi:hypothetical protein